MEAYNGEHLSNILVFEFEHYNKDMWDVCETGSVFSAMLVSWIKGGVKHPRLWQQNGL